MKKMLSLFILLIFNINCFSEEYHMYKMEKIKIFPEGKGKNELGIRTNSIDNSPKAIFIGSDGQFLISDFKKYIPEYVGKVVDKLLD